MPNLVSVDTSKTLIASLAAGAAAGTYYSADQANNGRAGIALGVNVSADTGGTGTVTVTIQGKDAVSGLYYPILASTAQNVASGIKRLLVYPGVTAAANASASDVLPATWRVMAVVGTAACTATIGASLLV